MNNNAIEILSKKDPEFAKILTDYICKSCEVTLLIKTNTISGLYYLNEIKNRLHNQILKKLGCRNWDKRSLCCFSQKCEPCKKSKKCHQGQLAQYMADIFNKINLD